MGEDSALDAVTTLVETLVSLDLLSDTAKPLDKMVVATLGQRWYGDQLLDNTVIVQQGLNGEVFVKLPEGNYVSYTYDDATCAGTDKRCTHNVKTKTQVAKSGSGLANLVTGYTYESAFNQPASVTDPKGLVTHYTYTAQGLPATVSRPAPP